MTRRTRAEYQPFHGATLSRDLSDAIAPALAAWGPSKVLRALVLSWESRTTAEKAALLVQAASVESAAVALGDIACRWPPPSPTDMAKAEREWKAAAAKLSGEAVLSDLEWEVLRLRWLSPEPATHEQTAETAGLNSRQYAQILERRATHKLMKWLVAFLASQRR